MVRIGEVYESIFVTICNSFPFGFLWIVLGKMFAEEQIIIKRSAAVGMTVVSLITLYVEQYLVLRNRLPYKNDAYFSLLPLCISLFSIILNSQITVKNAKKLRVISTVTYVLHSSALVPIFMLLNRINGLTGEVKNLAAFFLDADLCAIAAVLIMTAEQHKGLRWLKWSH